MRLDELPKWAVPAACSAVAFGVGAAVGHILTKRQYKVVELKSVETTQLELDFDTTDFDREIGKATYTIRKMRDESEALMSNIKDLAILKDIPVEPSRANHPSVRHLRPEDIVVETMVGGDVVHVFAEDIIDENWDYEIERQGRDPRQPYVIHRDEYFNDEMDYGSAGFQTTYTYYAADDILTDERDVPVYDKDEVVGELKFGHGSGDPRIVYIRNEARESEFEIVLDDGAYQVIVMGGQLETDLAEEDLRHSRSPGKFRRDD